MPTSSQISAINAALSTERLSTYEKAVARVYTPHAALALYEWNARISAAFLFPQQVCEVAMRNAAATALKQVFGMYWPWSISFERSLPNPRGVYGMRSDLLSTRAKIADKNTGKVIAALALKFWVGLFAARFDQRLWTQHLRPTFPHLPAHLTTTQARCLIHQELDQIRRLRNRIAHHEPIFARNLQEDYARVRKLIAWKCQTTATWVDSREAVTSALLSRP